MKRYSLIVFAAMLLMPILAKAGNFSFDVIGAYNNVGDAKNQPGLGFGLGYQVHKDFNIITRTIFSFVTENKNKPDQIKYEHLMSMGGVEYVYFFPQYRLFWRSSFTIGYSETMIRSRTATGDYELRDKGANFAFSTGIQWIATQHLSPFLDLGYHNSYYYGDFEESKIGGYQILLGIRVYIFNTIDIGSDY